MTFQNLLFGHLSEEEMLLKDFYEDYFILRGKYRKTWCFNWIFAMFTFFVNTATLTYVKPAPIDSRSFSDKSTYFSKI